MENIYGWKIDFINFPLNQLDEKERYYITFYAKNGYQSRNKDTGGGTGKEQINDYRPHKGYYDGLEQGKKSLAKELLHIINLHLTVKLKEGKEHNKVSQKALEKFWDLLGSK